MADFARSKIEVRYYTDDFGPYVFDFSNSIPSGLTVAACTVRSFLGMIGITADLDDEVETTSELVDAENTAVSGDYGVAVYFDYPTTEDYIQGQNHTLIFELTLSNGGKHPYYFQYVNVK